VVTFSGHALPLVYVALLWFVATGLVVALDRRAFLLLASGLVALGATVAIVLLRDDTSTLATYASLTAAFAVWAWHEISFLTGTVTGPNRSACPAELGGLARFRASAATVIYHEIALALTLVALLALTWGTANMTGTWAFAILFAMRLSTKFNLYLGVPNFSPDLLPARLAYLKTHFRKRRFNALMPVSLIGSAALTIALLDTPLLAALALLGLIEHLFLVVPFRDGALWRWAIPAPKTNLTGEI
jgi:putative photosynthetic complex assembly protein 2